MDIGLLFFVFRGNNTQTNNNTSCNASERATSDERRAVKKEQRGKNLQADLFLRGFLFLLVSVPSLISNKLLDLIPISSMLCNLHV